MFCVGSSIIETYIFYTYMVSYIESEVEPLGTVVYVVLTVDI